MRNPQGCCLDSLEEGRAELLNDSPPASLDVVTILSQIRGSLAAFAVFIYFPTCFIAASSRPLHNLAALLLEGREGEERGGGRRKKAWRKERSSNPSCLAEREREMEEEEEDEMLYVGRKKVVHTLLFLQAMVETCNKILVQFIMQRSGRKKENNKKKISSAKQRLITDIVLGRDSPATISAKTFAFSRKCFINFILPFLVSFFSPGDDGVQCIKILRTQK